ncbi:MAG: hypothetical protein AMXMBFR16_09630 [Candidatus Uhrbacteria bacterium]
MAFGRDVDEQSQEVKSEIGGMKSDHEVRHCWDKGKHQKYKGSNGNEELSRRETR